MAKSFLSLTQPEEAYGFPSGRPWSFWAGGKLAYARFSVKSCQQIRAIRRAVAMIAVLAFLPRARLRL